MKTGQLQKPYRWVHLDHSDISFYKVPLPLPWPADAAQEIDQKKEFPFHTLLEGIRLLQQDTKTKPDPIWPRLARIVREQTEVAQALQTPDLDRAEKLLLRHHALNPGSPSACFHLAFICKQRGDLARAVHYFQEAARGAPGLERIWTNLAATLEEQGRGSDAIAAFERVLALRPGDRAALEALARLGALIRLVRSSDGGEEEESYVTLLQFREILRKDIEELTARESRARLLDHAHTALEKDEGELAVLAVLGLLKINPNDPEAGPLLGEAYRVTGDLEKAQEILEHCIQENPRDTWAHYYLAWVQLDRGDAVAGSRLMDRALEIDPNLEAALVHKFNLGPTQNDPVVEARLAQWAEQNKSAIGYLLASITAEQRGDSKASLAHAARAYELNPQHRDALLQYTGRLMDCENREWAAALIQRSIKAGRGDHLVKYQFAWVLRSLALKEEAVQMLREALAEKTLPSDAKRDCTELLDLWEGRIAESEIELEQHQSGSLRRPMVLVIEGEERGAIMDGWGSLPQKKVIELQKKHPSTSAALSLQQGRASGESEPLALGVFQVDDLDLEKLDAEPPQFVLIATREGKLRAAAWQGKRRLAISWSLYPAPTFE